MKIAKASLLILLCLTAVVVVAQTRHTTSKVTSSQSTNAVAVDSQTGSNLICKGLPVPEGFTISGEMFADSCNGSAWILKRKPGAAVAFAPLDNRAAPGASTSLDSTSAVDDAKIGRAHV